jgi:hypothetical protein
MKPAMKKFIIYIRDEYMPSQDMNCKQYQLSIYDEENTEKYNINRTKQLSTNQGELMWDNGEYIKYV